MEYGYVPRTAPFAHQSTAFARSARKLCYALLMEAGTGKSKVIVDTAAYLYEHNKITGLLIYAPNDVDEQWLVQELPKHMPERVRWRAALWDAKSVKHRRLCTELATHPLPARLAVLAINHEALTTAAGRTLVQQFLRTYITLFCVDEAHAIKSHRAVRTKWATLLGKKAYCRRLLTGTPITKTPFDLFAQFKFLDERIIGFDSYVAFTHRYGEFTKEFVHRFDRRKQCKVLQEYEALQGYKNLDELYARVEPYVVRQLKKDCLDLPPKLYSVVTVGLSPAQRALYEAVKQEGVTLLQQVEKGQAVKVLSVAGCGGAGDEGTEEEEVRLVQRIRDPVGRLTAQIKLVTLLRCRQIVGGYIKTDEGEVRCIDGVPAKNPRLKAAMVWMESVAQSPAGKVMVWARFTAELLALYALMQEAGYECCLVHGASTTAQRRKDIAAFKDRKSPLRLMLTHEQSMGVGMDFNMVSDMLFYSSSYSYYQRDQAENRAHRIGSQGTVTITDLFARDVGIDRSMACARKQAEGFQTQFMQWNAAALQEQI